MKMKIRLITAIFFLFISAGFGFSLFSQGVKLTKAGVWGTHEYRQMVLRGNYAYCAASWAGLDILDISNSTKPVKIGGIETMMGDATSVAVYGNYAFVMHEDEYKGRLQVVDISSPQNPRLLGYYPELASSTMVAASGNYVYATGFCGLKILDVSNPSQPKPVRTYTASWCSSDIVVSGHYAYVAAREGGFHILDISQSPNLIHVGSNINVQPEKVIVSGNYAYTLNGKMFQVLNISNPEKPTLNGTYRINEYYDGILGFAASGHYVYITMSYCDLDCQEGHSDPGYFFQAIDVSKPSAPTLAGEFETKADIKSLLLKGTYVYASSSTDGIQVIDVSDPAAPVKVGNLDEIESPKNFVLFGKYAYLLGGKNHLLVLDISDPAAMKKAGKYTGMDSPRDMAISGRYAYLVGNENILHVLDISRPEAPVQVSKYTTAIYPGRIVVSGNYAYVANTAFLEPIEVINISNPAKPTQAALWPGSYNDVAVSGNHIYAAEEFYYFKDMANGRCQLNGRIRGISFSGQYAYIAADVGKLGVVKVSNSAAPVVVKKGITQHVTYDTAVSGKYLFTPVRYAVLQVLDISNPAIPVPVAINDTPVDGRHVAAAGDYCYLAGGEGGRFYAFQVSEVPAQSITVTSPNGGENWQRNTSHNITWSQSGLSGNVTLDLYKSGVFHSNIGIVTANAGSFPWSIPDNTTPGSDYKVRIYQGNINDYSDNNFSITAPPKIVLNRHTLNFGAIEGYLTPAQSVIITNSGGGTLNWIASANTTWIIISPSAGAGNGVMQVEVNPTGASPGTYTGKITIADPAASNSPQEITITMKVWETGTGPFGEFSTPVDGTTVSGSIPVTGWALDDLEVTSVKIYRNPVNGEGSERVFIGTALFVEGARPDVESAYPDFPFNYRAGWGYMMLTNMLPNQGNGAFTLYADAQDIEGNIIILGTKTITCNNAQAVKPFGAIDTPAQGGTAAGNSYVNYGWALTPLPNTIPTDGSTIKVWVDGLSLGHPVYNIYRADVATLFPGYNNSNGAIGYYYLDTTQYTNGVHTIAWTAKDNADNEDGIGSRYFTIQNTGNDMKLGIGDQEAGIREKHRGGPAFSAWSPIFDSGTTTVRVKKGFNTDTEANEVYPDDNGRIEINIRELERIEIDFSQPMENLSPLPIGSTFNSNAGIFYWQPGAGFTGTYHFVFREQGQKGLQQRKEIIIIISPKFR